MVNLDARCRHTEAPTKDTIADRNATVNANAPPPQSGKHLNKLIRQYVHFPAVESKGMPAHPGICRKVHRIAGGVLRRQINCRSNV